MSTAPADRLQTSGAEATPPEDPAHPDLDLEPPPPVVTRTRSGRRVRTPAALLDSQLPSLVRTPQRRARRPLVQELPEEEAEDPETRRPAGEHILHTHKLDGFMSDTSKEKENEARPATLLESAPESAPEPQNKGAKKRSHSESSEKHSSIPLGKPKSGRVWKDRNKQRFSALLRDKPLRSSWEKKMEAKREKDLVKKYSLQLKEEKARKKEDKRKRREENLKRRAENERKGEVVQVIRNTTKIKRMKKKQLRKIEKRDTLAMLQKSQPRTPKAAGEGSKGRL